MPAGPAAAGATRGLPAPRRFDARRLDISDREFIQQRLQQQNVHQIAGTVVGYTVITLMGAGVQFLGDLVFHRMCTDTAVASRFAGSGDEGEGTRAANFRTAPRPPALSGCRVRTRTGSTTHCLLECARSPQETLGYDQPRDFRVHGAQRARRAVHVQQARVNTDQWRPRGRRSQEHGPQAEAGFPS